VTTEAEHARQLTGHSHPMVLEIRSLVRAQKMPGVVELRGKKQQRQDLIITTLL